MSDVYAIVNLEGYAEEMRTAAAKTFSDTSTTELNEYISVKQIINLVYEKCLGFDDENRPMLNETINESIYEDISVWIHNVGLARLGVKTLLNVHGIMI